MALLGAQLVITLIVISIIQKVGPYFSFARWLLCSTGLIRYLYPTDGELKKVANIPKEKYKNKNKKVHTNGTSMESFLVPKNLSINLESTKVIISDVIHLRYYTEFQWFFDFTIYSLMVYTITEVYQNWFSLEDEINLSIVWLLLVLLFGLKLMGSLTVHYFQSEDSGERSTCIVMGLCYFLLSMVVLIIDENILELGLENAYKSFSTSASEFLSKQNLTSSGPASKIVLQFFMSVFCGILGAFFTFPGLRIAKMHWDLLKHYRDRRHIQFLLNISFSLPFILVILWIKPVSRFYLTKRIFLGMSQPLLSNASFDTLRIVLTISTIAQKTFLMPWYLQVYLDMAYHRTEDQKKEAGRISNVNYQKNIAAVFYYLCVVTLQYVVPLITCLIFILMYKTLGEFNWSSLWYRYGPAMEQCVNPTMQPIDPFNISNTENSVVDFHLALENFKSIFTVDVFRGLLGFFTWWTCFLYFATTSIGLIYQSNFSVY